MADFVYFERMPSSEIGYRVFHSPSDSPYASLENAVFAAFIKSSGEEAELPAELEGMKAEQRRIGNIELSIISSEFSLYETPMKSKSPESEAQYAGHVLREGEEFGMLLQYLPRGAATTAHTHTHKEKYFIIYGCATAYMLDSNARPGKEASEFLLGEGGRSRGNALNIPGNTWHPLKGGSNDSLIAIVAHRSIVEDQVYGTANNHHKSLSFEAFSRKFTISGRQRMHGPFATGLEGGSQLQ